MLHSLYSWLYTRTLKTNERKTEAKNEVKQSFDFIAIAFTIGVSLVISLSAFWVVTAIVGIYF